MCDETWCLFFFIALYIRHCVYSTIKVEAISFDEMKWKKKEKRCTQLTFEERDFCESFFSFFILFLIPRCLGMGMRMALAAWHTDSLRYTLGWTVCYGRRYIIYFDDITALCSIYYDYYFLYTFVGWISLCDVYAPGFIWLWIVMTLLYRPIRRRYHRWLRLAVAGCCYYCFVHLLLFFFSFSFFIVFDVTDFSSLLRIFFFFWKPGAQTVIYRHIFVVYKSR